VPDERDAACEIERARAHRTRGDDVERAADVVERLEDRQRPSRDGAAAGDPRGGDERESSDPRRLSGRELRGKEAAERMADHVHPLEAGCVEPAREPRAHLDEPGDVPRPRQVEDVHAMALGQRVEERRPPAPGAGEPVHEYERLAFPGDAIPDRAALDGDLSQLHRDGSGRA